MSTEWPEDVLAELKDPEFITRKHYSRATYALGCHGPLCGKAEKDRGRDRNKERAEAEGREYKPKDKLRDTSRDEELDNIIEEYLLSRLQLVEESA